MPKKKYVVRLSEEEQDGLLTLVKQGKAKARTINRAHAFLLSDEGKTDGEIALVLRVSRGTVHNWRKHLAEEGWEAALDERPRPGKAPKLDVKGEATLVAFACSDPPEGREHWTMQLLADKLVELDVVASISDETVRRTLKKTGSSRGRSSSGASRR
ncbi:MAG: hypothetical protein A2Z21_09810 [Candidatus Fraserbacteria bacterium RBG_16_55_9]|uniref:Transposase n=1 Tax=Fraserbacteria sp. (strain RBG_16_55_9) TaxID=1817864 RepID=A0A1F5UUK0_FRAXR|nr:MAG: hypothetical protein A2Z21_09810 [Candidatus Fraserbacteria bacterium RBG_16_55_9]